MHSSKRIALNTSAMYGNSIFGIIFSLFSTRWILQALGQSDFGLYGVVGGIIILITFISTTLSIGVARFYAYSIGEGTFHSKEKSTEELKQWFNTALSIHLLLPIFLVGVGWPIGEYAIKHWLTVPLDRVGASLWVFRASLVSAFMAILAVPFVSMFSAHQRLFELALFGIFRTLSVFVVSWYLLGVSSDRLVFYAFCMMVITASIPLMQIIRAFYRYDACRVNFSYMLNFSYLKKLLQFVGWKFFGTGCFTLRAQGTLVLVNLQFGPAVNAAYNLAFALSTHATALSASMTQAFQPAIVSKEGSGDRKNTITMSIQACKWGALLSLIFAIPLIVEIENLLQLWLKTPPAYAAEICQWLLGMAIVDRLTSGQMMAVNAYGKIALYELIQGLILFSALPVMWLFFRWSLEPVFAGFTLFITMLFYCIGRVIFAKCLLDFPIWMWIRDVGLPIMLILILTFLAGSLSVENLSEGFLRLCLTGIITSSVALLLACLVLFKKNDRLLLLNYAKSLVSKIPILGELIYRK